MCLGAAQGPSWSCWDGHSRPSPSCPQVLEVQQHRFTAAAVQSVRERRLPVAAAGACGWGGVVIRLPRTLKASTM